MSVTQDSWWGETMTLTAETEAPDGTITTVPVAGLQSVSISATGEHTTLYTADSVLRDDVRKGQMEVSVEFEYAKWDAEFVKEWLNGAAGTSLTIEDTSEVKLFDITGSVTNAGGSVLEVEIVDAYFEEIDIFDASMGEFISKNESGTGKNVNLTETA